MASYSDDFNRADGASLGAPWLESERQSPNDSQIVTNRVQSLSAISSSSIFASLLIYDDVWTDNHSSQVTFESILNAAVGGPGIRLSGTYNSASGYTALYDGTDLKLFLISAYDISATSITATQLGSTYTVGLISGDIIKLTGTGANLVVLVNDVERITATNGVVTTGKGGIVGHGFTNAATRAIYWNAWAGADLAAASGLGGSLSAQVVRASYFGLGLGVR